MKLIPTASWHFEQIENILTANFADNASIVFIGNTGEVFRFSITDNTYSPLFSMEKSLEYYSDETFSPDTAKMLYCHENIVVAANTFGTKAVLHITGKHHSIVLHREDYHAKITKFPIGIFKDSTGTNHLIYGTGWNRVEIMNMDTLQILTAAKSVIEQDAEKRYMIPSTNLPAHSNPWPSKFDYFYGAIAVSPNQKRFISMGWVWGSNDSFYIFDIDDFISNPRITFTSTDAWEHNDRTTCWIDDNRIAVAINPYEDNEEDGLKESPCQIYIYRVDSNSPYIETKVVVPGHYIIKTTMHYLHDSNAFLLYGATTGVLIVSLSGEILLHEPDVRPVNYNESTKEILLISGNNTIEIYQITL